MEPQISGGENTFREYWISLANGTWSANYCPKGEKTNGPPQLLQTLHTKIFTQQLNPFTSCYLIQSNPI